MFPSDSFPKSTRHEADGRIVRKDKVQGTCRINDFCLALHLLGQEGLA